MPEPSIEIEFDRRRNFSARFVLFHTMNRKGHRTPGDLYVAAVGEKLRHAYGDVAPQELSAEIRHLLRALDEADARGDGQQG